MLLFPGKASEFYDSKANDYGIFFVYALNIVRQMKKKILHKYYENTGINITKLCKNI